MAGARAGAILTTKNYFFISSIYKVRPYQQDDEDPGETYHAGIQ